MRLTWLKVSLWGFLFSAVASAQWSGDRGFHDWYFWGGGYWQSSTIQEGYLRGLGAYFDGLGRLRVQDAMAAQHFEKAYRLYLRNRKLSVQTRHEIRQMRDEYIKQRRRKPMSKEQLELHAKARLPNRLEGLAFDGQGRPLWPVLLRSPVFAQDRALLEELFEQRQADPENSGLGSDNHLQVKAAVDALLEQLRLRIREYDPNAYLKARGFLESLAFEARFLPVESDPA